MSSIMRCRSGLMALSVMRDAPVLMEVAKPLISRQDALTRYPIGRIVRRCALPRERFSPLVQTRTFRRSRIKSALPRYAVAVNAEPRLSSALHPASCRLLFFPRRTSLRGLMAKRPDVGGNSVQVG